MTSIEVLWKCHLLTLSKTCLRLRSSAYPWGSYENIERLEDTIRKSYLLKYSKSIVWIVCKSDFKNGSIVKSDLRYISCSTCQTECEEGKSFGMFCKTFLTIVILRILDLGIQINTDLWDFINTLILWFDFIFISI